MEEGFVPDQTQGGAVVSRWVAGRPEATIWRGLKLRGKDQRQIVTYRCPACGYLESYVR
jgi:hypothetical protein